LIIPLFTAAFVYVLQIREIEKDIQQNRVNTLKLNKRIVESAILTIDDIINDLRNDVRLAQFLAMDDPLGLKAEVLLLPLSTARRWRSFCASILLRTLDLHLSGFLTAAY
jgi:hypothetical protein